METIQQMKNLDELKERIQDDIQNWHRNLEGENQYPHLNKVIYEDEDLNKLFKIVTDRINEYKMFDSAQLVVDDEIYDFGPEC